MARHPTFAVNIVVHEGAGPARQVAQLDAGPSLAGCRILYKHNPSDKAHADAGKSSQALLSLSEDDGSAFTAVWAADMSLR